MRNSITSVSLSVITALMLLSGSAIAQEGGNKRGHRGPPPEAIEACSNAEVNQACEFAGRRGETVSGSCIIPRNGDSQALACKPSGDRPEGKPERSESEGDS